jgi:hypothetical protein
MELLAQIKSLTDAIIASPEEEAARAAAAAAAPAPAATATHLPQPLYKPPKAVGIAIAAATGAFFKLYDDFIDLSLLPESHFIMELFKVGITVFTTLLLVQDVYITFLFLFLSVLELTLKSADTPYWRAGIIIPLVIALLHLPHFVAPTGGFVLTFILLTALMLFIVYIEKQIFPEETSSNKIINRCALLAASGFMIYNSSKYESHPYIPLVGGWAAGYMFIYVVTHIFDLFRKRAAAAKEDE